MKRRILGFQRRVWWPKWTPASSSSRMETTDMLVPFWLRNCQPAGPGWNRRPSNAGTATRAEPPGRVQKPLHLSRSSRRFAAYAEHMAAEGSPTPSLARLADQMRESADELALEVVEEGLREDQLPSLERLGRAGQLSDMPTFLAARARRLTHPH